MVREDLHEEWRGHRVKGLGHVKFQEQRRHLLPMKHFDRLMDKSIVILDEPPNKEGALIMTHEPSQLLIALEQEF